MNRTTTILLIAASLGLAATATAEPPRLNPEVLRKIEPRHDVLRPELRDRVVLPRRPDLAVTKAELEGIHTRDGRVFTRLRVTVKNIGLANWRSAPGQQTLMAYAGRRAIKVSDNLKALDAGASRKFKIDMPNLWGRGIEFPPNLKVSLIFDPDIRNDGNSANDDANLRNNAVYIDGAAANEMVRR